MEMLIKKKEMKRPKLTLRKEKTIKKNFKAAKKTAKKPKRGKLRISKKRY